MKKSLILVLLQLSLASLCSAQFINSLEIRAGSNWAKPINKKGDGALTNTSFKDVFDPKMGLNFEVNAFMALDSQLYYGVGLHYVELHYAHQLCCLRTGNDIMNFSYSSFQNTAKMTNVGASIIARYDIGRKRKLVQVVGGVGFYKSFNNISITKLERFGNGPIDTVFQTLVIDDISNSFNISVQFGFRVLVPIGKRSHISLGSKVEYFFLPDEYYYASFKGNLLSIGGSLGYIINL